MTLKTSEIETVINDLHDFLTDWVGGRCPGDPKTFRRNALDRLSDDFVAVVPAGRALGKGEFGSQMSSLYGSNPEFRVEIRDFGVRHTGSGIAVVGYREWRKSSKDDETPENGRIATMILGETAGGGVEILRLHETWLPDEVVAEERFGT